MTGLFAWARTVLFLCPREDLKNSRQAGVGPSLSDFRVARGQARRPTCRTYARGSWLSNVSVTLQDGLYGHMTRAVTHRDVGGVDIGLRRHVGY